MNLRKCIPMSLPILAAGFLGACNLDTATAEADAELTAKAQSANSSQKQTSQTNTAPKTSAAPTTSAAASTKPSPGPFSNTFLWKPASVKNGNLSILIPYPLGIPTSVTANGVSGGFSSTGPKDDGRANFRFSRPGGAFGGPVTVVARFGNGTSRTWSIPNGAKRTEIPL